MVEYPWGEERIYKKSAKAECSDYREKSHSSNTLNNLSNFQLSRLTTDEVEITGLVDFDSTGQLLIIYFSIVEYLKKLGIQCGSASYIYRLQETLWFSQEGGNV